MLVNGCVIKNQVFRVSFDNIIVDLEDEEEEEEEEEEVGVDNDREVGNDAMEDDNGINDNYTLVQIDRTGVELTLPTGSRIGHRSMARYYRQNIALPTEASEASKTVALVDRRFALGLSLRSYQAGEGNQKDRAKDQEQLRKKDQVQQS